MHSDWQHLRNLLLSNFYLDWIVILYEFPLDDPVLILKSKMDTIAAAIFVWIENPRY